MKYLIIVTFLIVLGCGVKIKPEPIKIETSPIEVNHKVILDTDALYKFYQIVCADEVPDPSNQAQINACADEKLNDFISEFTILL